LRPVDVWQVPNGEQTGDRDFGSTPTLFAYTDRAGVTHPMVGVGHKNGTYYAFDRNHLAAGPVWQRTIAAAGTQPLADVGIISPSAFDGARLYVAGERTVDGSDCAGSLRALNPADGALIWVHCMPDGPVFGAVTTANGIAVVGEGPRIVMVDASSGATVFTFLNPSGAWFYGAASIAHGALYQASTDGTLFAFVPGLGPANATGLLPRDNGGEVADVPRQA
jgi:outer membrane protein assembly factor BamB